MTVVDAIGASAPAGDPRAPARTAIGYVDVCLRANPNLSGSLLDRLTRRRDRLATLAASPPRPPRDTDEAVNLRLLHSEVLGLAPTALPARPSRRQLTAGPPPMVFPARGRGWR